MVAESETDRLRRPAGPDDQGALDLALVQHGREGLQEAIIIGVQSFPHVVDVDDGIAGADLLGLAADLA